MSAAVDFDSFETDLAECLDDFRQFAGLLPIKTKTEGIVYFEYERWHDEQKLFDIERTGWDVVLKPRQIGFSTLELARDFHHALKFEGHNVLVVVHDEKLKSQLFEALRMFADELHDIGMLPETRYSTKTEIVFKHTGSAVRIVESGANEIAAKKKGRSGTVHRLHATEMSFWGSAGNTMPAVLSSLVDRHLGGELVIESTTNGAGGEFHETVKAAQEPGSEYKLHFFPWYEHKAYSRPCAPDFNPGPLSPWEVKLRARGVNDQQISWWRAKVKEPSMGIDKALAEFPCDPETCFRATGRTYYDADTTDYMALTVRPLVREAELKFKGRTFGRAHIFKPAVPGHKYVIGADVAEGIGGDFHAAVVLDRADGEMVATFRCNDIEPGDFGLALAVLGWMYNTAVVAPERNNHGHATLRALTKGVKGGYREIYKAKDERNGWSTDSATRPPLFDELYTACRTKAYACRDRRVLDEAKTLVIGKDGKPRARDKGKLKGCHDDLMIAWGIAHQVRSAPVWQGGAFKFKGA